MFAYDPESVVICPYDKNHKISKDRIQAHLVKCEKKFPPGYKEICPFNATHRVFKSELERHIQECPVQRYIDPGLYHGSKANERLSSVMLNTLEVPDCDQDWSEDNESQRSNLSRGFSLSYINDLTDDTLSVTSSITSSMCIGRGLPRLRQPEKPTNIGQGHGKRMDRNA